MAVLEAVRVDRDVLGSNEFAQKRVGAVIGSNHYGDGYIKKWGAYAGTAVEREDEAKGAGLSYGRFGNQILTHMREHDTLQAAMRFGRDAGGAVVYVHTDTLPDWVPVADEGRVLNTWSDGLRSVIDAVEELDAATTAEIADHPDVDIEQRQVFEHLESLRDRGVLERDQDPEDGRRFVWRDDGLHRIGEHGDAELGTVDLGDLDSDEVGELARTSSYTWEFRNFDADPGSSNGTASSPAGADGDPPNSEGSGPPDRAESGD